MRGDHRLSPCWRVRPTLPPGVGSAARWSSKRPSPPAPQARRERAAPPTGAGARVVARTGRGKRSAQHSGGLPPRPAARQGAASAATTAPAGPGSEPPAPRSNTPHRAALAATGEGGRRQPRGGKGASRRGLSPRRRRPPPTRRLDPTPTREQGAARDRRR